jgi:hypothetical protein
LGGEHFDHCAIVGEPNGDGYFGEVLLKSLGNASAFAALEDGLSSNAAGGEIDYGNGDQRHQYLHLDLLCRQQSQ